MENDARGDLFIVIGFLVVLWIAWVATGGPERATSGERVPVGSGADVRSQRVLDDAREDFARERDAGVASPYRGLVSFSGGQPRAELARHEYVRIRASSGLDAPVNVSGWRIESLITGAYGTVPGATPLPQMGVVNSEPPLFLEPGDVAVINSGRSSIGVSFRDNTCGGYLDPRDHLTPRLVRQCPRPIDEFEAFSGIAPFGPRDEKFDECRTFIRRHIDRCEVTTEELDERDEDIPELPLSDQCIAFIERDLTYQGCLENHAADPDFFDREWRVFLGSFSELWRKDYEVLRLLDRERRVVDVWQY